MEAVARGGRALGWRERLEDRRVLAPVLIGPAILFIESISQQVEEIFQKWRDQGKI